MRPDACDVSEMRAVRPVVKDEGRIDNLRERVKKRRRGNGLLQRGEGWRLTAMHSLTFTPFGTSSVKGIWRLS